MDSGGQHAVECSAKGERTLRHNDVRRCLQALLRSAGVHVQHEPTGLLPGAPERRLGDLFLPTWADGRPVAVDFMVTSPMQRDHRHLSAQAGGVAAEAGAAAKVADCKGGSTGTADLCAQAGIVFVPLVFETYGGCCASGQVFLKECATFLAENRGEHLSVQTDQLYQLLSITLQRANARMLLARRDGADSDLAVDPLHAVLEDAPHVPPSPTNSASSSRPRTPDPPVPPADTPGSATGPFESTLCSALRGLALTDYLGGFVHARAGARFPGDARKITCMLCDLGPAECIRLLSGPVARLDERLIEAEQVLRHHRLASAQGPAVDP
eukprot:gene6533-1515_t